MNDNLFGVWLTEQQKHSGLSDTKLAAALGVTAPTISRWKSGIVKPRDEDVLDRLAEFFGEDRARVYTLAGRGQSGMDVKDMAPEVIVLAKYINSLIEEIRDPRVREFAFARLQANVNDLASSIEYVQDMLDKNQE